jgi:hypothetical protein
MLGAHIFYRMPGAAGELTAFVRRAASLEPEISLLRAGRGRATSSTEKGRGNGAV